MKGTFCVPAVVALAALGLPACGVIGERGDGKPEKAGINKDALTMQDCRDRLALPKDKRRKSDDPRVDLDGVCENMLSAKETPKPASAKASASTPDRSPSR